MLPSFFRFVAFSSFWLNKLTVMGYECALEYASDSSALKDCYIEMGFESSWLELESWCCWYASWLDMVWLIGEVIKFN